MKIRSAKSVAILMLLNSKEYGNSREKEITRFAHSVSNLAELFGYVDGLIPDVALQQLTFELRQRGYLFFHITHTHVGVMSLHQSSNWPRTSFSRIKDYLAASEDELENILNGVEISEMGDELDRITRDTPDAEDDLQPDTWSFDRLQEYFSKHLTNLDINDYTTWQAACVVHLHMREHNIVPRNKD